MFDMREFVMKSLTDAAKVEPAYKVRETAATWHSKGILTEDDLAIVDGLLPSYGTTLEQAQATRQALNKQALTDWLKAHPLTWTDGKQYGTTLEDQTEMALNFTQYQAAVQAGTPATLEWHAVKEACTEFTPENFLALSLAVSTYVYPYCRHQEQIKEQIYAAQSVEAVKAIPIDYSTVGQEDEGVDNVG